MEDAHFLDLDWGGRGWVYGGIYDGHNGNYAANYTSKHLPQICLEKLLSGLTPQQAFTIGYETISNELINENSGTTAVDFLIRDNRIFTANVGDARAIIVSRYQVQQLTLDHRVDEPEERARVIAQGASIQYPYVIREYQGLMPTRTLGDPFFKPVGVIASPSLAEYDIVQDDLMLISACDGLWDFIDNGEVADFVREIPDPPVLLEALKREVLVNRMGTDNLTIIAVDLRSSPVSNPANTFLSQDASLQHD